MILIISKIYAKLALICRNCVTLQEINIKLMNMFSKETYVSRRAELKKLVKSGIIILFGNNDSPAIFPYNAYSPFRQDSSFLYYFGQKRD